VTDRSHASATGKSLLCIISGRWLPVIGRFCFKE
jgi:hypothetical protein